MSARRTDRGLQVLIVLLVVVGVAIGALMTRLRGGVVAPAATTRANGGIGSGVLITGTLTFTEDGATANRWFYRISAFEADIVVAESDRRTDDDSRHWMERYSRHGSRWLRREYAAGGQLSVQNGRDLPVALPSVVAWACGCFSASQLDPQWRRTDGLLDFERYPLVDWTDLGDLVASGAATISVAPDYLGLPAEMVTVIPDEHFYPVTRAELVVAQGSGIKLRRLEWYRGNAGNPDSEFVATGVESDRQLGDTYLTPADIDPATSSPAEIRTNYVAAHAFDPTQGQGAPVPEAHDLLYPAQRPISGTFELASSAFVTGTIQDQLLDCYLCSEVTRVMTPAWFVTQEITATAPSASALIIQGLGGDVLPIAGLAAAWPRYWSSLEAENNTGVAGHARGTFTDGKEYDSYRIVSQAELGEGPSRSPFVGEYERMVTWMEGDHVRLVLLSEGLSAVGTVELAEEYRRSAGKL